MPAPGLGAPSDASPDDADARCPQCGSDARHLRYRITDFRVYDCASCGVVYLWPQIDDDTVRELFQTLYTEGEGSVPELKTYYDFTYHDRPDNPLVDQYERWLDSIERERQPGKLLDIGCGTGLFLAVARRRGWEPYGVDDCVEATSHARDHFGLDVWNGQFTEFAAREGLRFDAVTMWDVIEHARDPVGLLRAARSVLEPAGVVAVSTPNQRNLMDDVAGLLYRATGGRLTGPLEKFYIEQHFLYYGPDTLRDAFDRAALDTLTLHREETDLRRLSLAWPVRAGLEALFFTARRLGLENRLFALARLPDAAPAGGAPVGTAPTGPTRA
ncbi:MAG: class I SAM-dependent methyltransferase [Myxococcota bacterium]